MILQLARQNEGMFIRFEGDLICTSTGQAHAQIYLS
jgi:hypothetical protein